MSNPTSSVSTFKIVEFVLFLNINLILPLDLSTQFSFNQSIIGLQNSGGECEKQAFGLLLNFTGKGLSSSVKRISILTGRQDGGADPKMSGVMT